MSRDPVVVGGVDAGGTRVKGAVFAIRGGGVEVVNVVSVEGGANPANGGVEKATEILATAVAKLFDGIAYEGVAGRGLICGIGCAGGGGHVDEAVKRAGVRGIVYTVTDDVPIAFMAGTARLNGRCLIAGTGSVAARVEDGVVAARSGGWGWLIGDDGGGVWIGREIARAVFGEVDGLGPPTVLSRLLAEFWEVERSELRAGRRDHIYRATVPVTGLGAVAHLLDKAGSDDVAKGIRRMAADRLIEMLDVLGESSPVVGVGSVLRSGVGRLVRESFPEMVVVNDGVVGAAVGALRKSGVGVDDSLHEVLREGYERTG